MNWAGRYGVLQGELMDVELGFGPPRLCKREKAISFTNPDHRRYASLMRGQELYCFQVVAGRKKNSAIYAERLRAGVSRARLAAMCF